MLDPKYLRQSKAAVAAKLKARGYILDIKKFDDLEAARKSVQTETEALQNKRNALSKSIGEKKAKGESVQAILEEVNGVGKALDDLKVKLAEIQQAMTAFLVRIPNLPHDSVPDGANEDDNVEVRRHGEPKVMDFPIQSHDALGSALGYMDFASAAKLSGARFVVLKGPLARLQRALIQWMLDLHITEHGYEEYYVPYLVNEASLFGTGQLPKFLTDQYRTEGDDGLFLIPTAEVPLTNLARDAILEAADLPCRFAAHTPCFRREAGAYGKDTKGMIRQHQFEKVELVWLTKPENSYEALEQLTHHAEVILQRLALPYRVMTLCKGDLGNSAAKTYDLDVWIPSQNAYREISSCSNMEDYQARRMQGRFREKGEKPQLLHTLNGSGVAAGRALVAIMENYQQKDGHIAVPDVLKPYMGGVAVI